MLHKNNGEITMQTNTKINNDSQKLWHDANLFNLDGVQHYLITIKADDLVIDKYLACSYHEVIQEFFGRIYNNKKLIFSIYEGAIKEISSYYCDKQGELQPLSLRFSYGTNDK
jgi:hypothetical protein